MGEKASLCVVCADGYLFRELDCRIGTKFCAKKKEKKKEFYEIVPPERSMVESFKRL